MRRTRFQIAVLLVIAIVAVAVAIVIMRSPPKPVPVRATISGLRRVPFTVTDPSDVEQLASYFPGFGQGRSNRYQAGWAWDIALTFSDAAGKQYKLGVSPHNGWWSEGWGDWSVENVDELLVLIDRLETEYSAAEKVGGGDR